MTNTMSNKAKLMIGAGAFASLCALLYGLRESVIQSWPQFLLLLTAAVLTSRFKVRLPGMTSTMSGNLPVILLGILRLNLLGSLIIAATAGVAQSLTSGPKKAKPVQLLFNACNLLNASALGYWAFHYKAVEASLGSHMLSLVLAAAAYFVANTTPLAGIISLTEGGKAFSLWHKVFLWTFPNYVIGAGMAAITSAFGTTLGWITAIALVSVLFAVYQSYQTYVAPFADVQLKAMATAASR
jgi:hypothetical protein